MFASWNTRRLARWRKTQRTGNMGPSKQGGFMGDSVNGWPQEEKRAGWPWWAWALLSPFILFGLMMIYQMVKPETADDRAIASARRTIELCWDDQGKKSLTPGSARSIAGICENLESEFRSKWRRSP